jgi:hypothetical protein
MSAPTHFTSATRRCWRGLFLSGGGNLCSAWPELIRQRVLLMREAFRREIPAVTGGQTIGPGLTAVERSALAPSVDAPRLARAGRGRCGVADDVSRPVPGSGNL